jgi:hypothetical protein
MIVCTVSCGVSTMQFGGDEQKLMSMGSVKLDEAVVKGAAIQGYDLLQGEEEVDDGEEEGADEEEDLAPQKCRGCLCAPAEDFDEFQAVLDGMKARQIGHHAPWRGSPEPLSWSSLDWHAENVGQGQDDLFERSQGGEEGGEGGEEGGGRR